MYHELANSCSGGPCPTIHVEETSRDVLVQGYLTSTPIPVPTGEDVVHIPADAWRRLLADLPLRTLLVALLDKLMGRRALAATPQHQ